MIAAIARMLGTGRFGQMYEVARDFETLLAGE